MGKLKPQKVDIRKMPHVVIAKWSRALLDEGFVPLPKRVLRCLGEVFSGPTGIERFQALMAVVDYRRPVLDHQPSIEFLACTAGLPVEKFRSAMNEMEQLRFVKIKGTDAAYEVTIDGILKALENKTESEVPEEIRVESSKDELEF